MEPKIKEINQNILHCIKKLSQLTVQIGRMII